MGFYLKLPLPLQWHLILVSGTARRGNGGRRRRAALALKLRWALVTVIQLPWGTTWSSLASRSNLSCLMPS